MTWSVGWTGESLPREFDWAALASFGVFCVALMGPVLGTVVGDEIRESSSVVPWSVWRVAMLAVICYTLGAGALLIAAPDGTIHSVQGVLATAAAIAEPLGATRVVSVLGALL